MTEPAASPVATIITLRVAEARVEDIGHAVARLAPADLDRLQAHRGDILRITGRTVAPPLFQTMIVLGPDRVLERVDAAIEILASGIPNQAAG